MIRKQKYTAIKLSDTVVALTSTELVILGMLTQKIADYREFNNMPPLECVCIERDWPEYERVWQILEERVDNEEKETNI